MVPPHERRKGVLLGRIHRRGLHVTERVFPSKALPGFCPTLVPHILYLLPAPYSYLPYFYHCPPT